MFWFGGKGTVKSSTVLPQGPPGVSEGLHDSHPCALPAQLLSEGGERISHSVHILTVLSQSFIPWDLREMPGNVQSLSPISQS